MPEMPTVAVMLFTYDRLETAKLTISALASHLLYEGDLHLHIADDGSPPVDEALYAEALMSFAQAELDGDWPSSISFTNSQRSGYGGSYNVATQVVHSIADYLLPLEDDWELSRDFDLTPLVLDLIEDERAECIRLGYLGYTQAIRGEIIDLPHTGKALLLDPESPERHVFAGHPRLETRRFERAIGPWPEGLQAGKTEFEIAGREAARQGVIWPLDLGIPGSQRHDSLFRHIGFDEKGEIDPSV